VIIEGGLKLKLNPEMDKASGWAGLLQAPMRCEGLDEVGLLSVNLIKNR
jgi:hypothetical protein